MLKFKHISLGYGKILDILLILLIRFNIALGIVKDQYFSLVNTNCWYCKKKEILIKRKLKKYVTREESAFPNLKKLSIDFNTQLSECNDSCQNHKTVLHPQ